MVEIFREKFFEIVRTSGEKSFRLNFNMVFSHLKEENEDLKNTHMDNLLFGDYLFVEEEAKVYDEVKALCNSL